MMLLIIQILAIGLFGYFFWSMWKVHLHIQYLASQHPKWGVYYQEEKPCAHTAMSS